ncbi:MAG: N-acetyl-gamma-glutamyl-phosphate reductase [Thaumarchaeota archaeon]|nr:N-acetyl-gamma-glutamyl-phosphate reductase [Candidatus Calditenuaceae archaeon]MDW8041257.1 N-acetyl-gamma-glutamyl-phosphate reductase [Nitrososphaerota archaeon]
MGTKTVRVGIVGASGYTGGELLRLLATHPRAEVTVATSREYAGQPISNVHFNLKGFLGGLKFSQLSIDQLIGKCDVVFTSTPSGVSKDLAPKLVEHGLRVIDLSPDFRLKDPKLYEYWYDFTHGAPDLLSKAVYGLPELHRADLSNARLVACPGCNATAALLSLIPAVESKLIDLDHIVVDVKVGSSEAGMKPTLGTHHPERANVMRPYEASGHRHVAEVEQELSMLSGRSVRVALVPHAVGAVRGALATSHVWLADSSTDEMTVWKAYAKRYGQEPFVRIVRGGRHPDPKYVTGSNFADVGMAVEQRIGRAALLAAIDNLMKGAAGQAVQCMNLVCGFDEREGLYAPPLRPV